MKKIIFVIIGTLIGAGFASGQEIYLFFYVYGKQGLIGLALASTLISLVVYKVLSKIQCEQIESYSELLEKTTNKKFLTKVISNIVNIFVLITFFIMIAGFGAYFEEQIGIHHLIGSSILSVICFIVFNKNIQGVVKVNEIIIPFIIIFVLAIGVFTAKDTFYNSLNIEQTKSGFLVSSVLYAGYNSILLIPVLITLKRYIKNKSEIGKIALILNFITIVLGSIIFLVLSNVGENISNIELPVANVVSQLPKIMRIIYGAIIVMSIFTTAVSLGNSVLESTGKHRKLAQILMCITAVGVSNIGFSQLIESAYPIFGILGAVQIATLVLK